MPSARARENPEINERGDRAYRQILTIVGEQQKAMLEKIAVRYVAPEHFSWGLILIVAVMWQRVFDEIGRVRGDVDVVREQVERERTASFDQRVDLRTMLSEHRDEQAKLIASLSARIDALATSPSATPAQAASGTKRSLLIYLLVGLIAVACIGISYRIGEQHGRNGQAATDAYVAKHEAVRWRRFIDTTP